MSTVPDSPDLFIKENENANKGGVRCLRCGKPIKGKRFEVFQDFRVGEFHDFGGIPDDKVDGPYIVGPDCVESMRERAEYALAEAGITT